MFYACPFEIIELPPNLEEIGKECFQECENLRKVEFPASLRKIDLGAFGCCPSIKSFRFPPNLKTIHHSIFMYSPVEKATFEGPAPKMIGGDEFYQVPKNFQVFFVDGKNGFTWPTWCGVRATLLGPEIQGSQPFDTPITTRVSKDFFGARVPGYKRNKTFTVQNIGTRKLKHMSVYILDGAV